MPMTREEVVEKMKGPNVVVLNVLPDNDYAKLHIAGSENFPLGLSTSAFVQAVGKKYGRTKFFITYCAGFTCNAGLNAAQGLMEKGFKANYYPGGIKDWADAGFATEGTEAKVPTVAAAVAAVVSQ